MQASLRRWLTKFLFTDLLTNLDLKPPSLVGLEGNTGEGILVNSTDFRGEK